MRYVLTDVIKRPSRAGDWLLELPCRRRGWLRWLLFEKGQGWLRWGTDGRETAMRYDPPEPPEPYVVAPPLRRVWFWLRWSLHWRERASWAECWDHMRDDDRKRGRW